MTVKIKPGFSVGKEGIQIGFKVEWSHNNHRQREQRARRAASRERARQRIESGILYQAAEQLDPEWDERPPRKAKPKPKAKVYDFPARDPNVYRGSDWEKIIRKGHGDNPWLWRVLNRSAWSIWWIFTRGVYETAEEKYDPHRWDYDVPGKNPPVRKPAPGKWIPPEWEPPPRVVDEITKEVGEVLGKIRVGSVSIGDEGVLWDPEVWSKPVAMPKGKGVIVAEPQSRGQDKHRVIVVRPDPEPARVILPGPVARPLPQPRPIPRPATGPIPNTQAPPWARGVIAGVAAIAVGTTAWDLLPKVKLQTVSGRATAPEIRATVQPLARPWFKESRLHQDRKEESNLKYLAVMKFVDRYWGTASNIAEVGQVILENTHGTDGRSAPYGYKRWDRWIHDITRGTAEVDYEGVLVGLLMNEIEDRIVAGLNKAKLRSLAKAGNTELDREWRAMNQLYTRVTGESARVPRF